jgi:hypothetical protein
MGQRGSAAIVVLLIIIAVSLGIIGYFGYWENHGGRSLGIGDLTAEDLARNFKDYSNKYYSFKYPTSWTLSNLTGGEQVEIYYQSDKSKPVGSILAEHLKQAPADIGHYEEKKQIGNREAICKPDITKKRCFVSGSNISILTVSDKDPTYNKILEQILSTFNFAY